MVDDTPENIDVLNGILNEHYDVKVAINGVMALKIAEKLKPDLILQDIMMPVISGFEVKEYYNHNPKVKDVPVIFITSKTDQKDVRKGFDLGAVNYIRKPFDSQEVLARIKKHLP